MNLPRLYTTRVHLVKKIYMPPPQQSASNKIVSTYIIVGSSSSEKKQKAIKKNNHAVCPLVEHKKLVWSHQPW
jgi:hypothetical protein